MRPFRWLFVLLCVLIAAPIVVAAGDAGVATSNDANTPLNQGRATRYALVIGNSNYQQASALKNSISDTRAIGAALSGLGFEVMVLADVTGQQFRKAIGEFSRKIEAGDVALFYYAGHALQYDDANYLLPIDAAVERPSDLALEAQKLDDAIDAIASEGTTAIVILDACRNNPFVDRLSASGTSRALLVSGGLAPVQAGAGIFIGFATQPGKVAYDGGGENSPFASAILRHIATPGADIEVVMRRVRLDVIRETAGDQVPWSNSSLLEPGFVFNETAKDGDRWTPPPLADQRELQFWRSIENGTDPGMFRAYLTQFPGGMFEGMARQRVEKLEGVSKSRKANTGASKPKAKAAKPRGKTVKQSTSVTKKATSTQSADPSTKAQQTAKTQKAAPSSGRCRDGNMERCRERCAEGARGACRKLRRAGLKP